MDSERVRGLGWTEGGFWGWVLSWGFGEMSSLLCERVFVRWRIVK